jgi:cytochrome c peroxidase
MNPKMFERTRRTAGRAIAVGVVTLALVACGGGGSGTAATTAAAPTAAATVPAPSPTPAPTPASAATPATGVATFLNLDLTRLANYAAPTLPAYYDGAVTARDNTPASDPVSDRLATLGRVLFHDRRLSVNDTVSCASCHQPPTGFSDPQRFSIGFNGSSFTSAHSMRLGNLRYWTPGSMFWDRRAATLEAQATQPIQHPVEMGFDAANGGLAALLSKMNGLSYYPELFQFAFGDTAITEARIQRALAHFQRAMVSTGSRWDTAYATVFTPNAPNRALNVNLPGFSAEENRGRQLFMNAPNQGGAGCARCHEPPAFALDANSRSNGLDAGEARLFKSPSLKSVALGGPYMHDGRFATLAQVIEHYDSGVQPGPALDNRLRGGPLNLSAADKAALVAFLRTLDDTALTQDAKFSNPFLR